MHIIKLGRRATHVRKKLRLDIPSSIFQAMNLNISSSCIPNSSHSNTWYFSDLRSAHIGQFVMELFPPNKIDQRRHADVARALTGHAVVLGNLHLGQAAELRFEQRARIKIFHQRWPAGLVIQLLGPIALDQQQSGRPEGIADAGEHLPPLVRRQELNEDRRDHIECGRGPPPLDQIDLLGAQGHAALLGKRTCLAERGWRPVDRKHVETALGEPHAIAPFAVRDCKRCAGFRQCGGLRLEKYIRLGAEHIIRHRKSLFPALVFAIRQIHSSGASTIGSYRLRSRPSKFQLCTMWGGSGAVASMTPPRGCGTAMRRAKRCRRFWMPPGSVQFSLLKYFVSPTIGCPIWAKWARN